jgi:hypothetical protein
MLERTHPQDLHCKVVLLSKLAVGPWEAREYRHFLQGLKNPLPSQGISSSDK